MAGITVTLRRDATNWVCLICVISTSSNGAVQIRVGLELAEKCASGQGLGRNEDGLGSLGKSKGGLTNGGLSPKFSEKIGGKSFLENRAFSGQIGTISGLVGAFSGPIGTNSSAPHSHGGRAEIAPKGPFLARLAPFGLSPALLSPRLDFPEVNWPGIRARSWILFGDLRWPGESQCGTIDSQKFHNPRVVRVNLLKAAIRNFSALNTIRKEGVQLGNPETMCAIHCNLCGHLQRCQMPDIENSRITAEKGAEWVTAKQPKTSRKNSRNTRKTPENSQNSCFSGASAVFPAVFRVFYRDPLGTLFGCFSAVFRLSGIWHLCRWPQRLQCANICESIRANRAIQVGDRRNLLELILLECRNSRNEVG